MADYSITAASVVPPSGASLSSGTEVFGETVTQGMPVYKKASDKKIYKAKASTQAEAKAVGVAVVSGSAGQPAIYITGGIFPIGATIPAGTEVHVSGAAYGGIAPNTDYATGHWCTPLGVGDGAGNLDMTIHATAIQHA